MNCVQSERSMGLETRIKPISYLKAHSAEVFRELGEGAPPLLITQNGEPKAVLQDVASYVATRNCLRCSSCSPWPAMTWSLNGFSLLRVLRNAFAVAPSIICACANTGQMARTTPTPCWSIACCNARPVAEAADPWRVGSY